MRGGKSLLALAFLFLSCSDHQSHAFAGFTVASATTFGGSSASYQASLNNELTSARIRFTEITSHKGNHDRIVEERWNTPNFIYLLQRALRKSKSVLRCSSSSDYTSILSECKTDKHEDATSLASDKITFYIREARYKDLTASSSILYDGFFEPKSLFKQFGVIKLLDRLQSNYPYGDRDHFMFVAVTNKPDTGEELVIGFVDIDARFLDKPPPKPYLSDLAVHLNWRRQGVATGLITACERKALQMGYDCLYLRVDHDNDAAISMYGSMGYDIVDHDIYGKRPLDTTLLLKRSFTTQRAQELASLTSGTDTCKLRYF